MNRRPTTLQSPRQPLPGIAAAAFAYACGYALRYGLVEPEKLGAACERAKPWWCAPRTAFIVFTEWNGFGWLSVALAALAVALLVSAGRGRAAAGPRVHGLATAAMISGGAGLVLYNTTFAAAAVIVALLVLCGRPVAGAASEHAP